MYIIVRKYEGFNHALGKYIKSRKHYEDEMRRGGYVPYDGESQPKRSEWIPSADLKKTLGELKVTSKNGKINCGSKLKKKMESMGVQFNPRFMPNDTQGGFNAV